MRRLGDLIARDAAKLAATEVRDNGKLLAEMRGPAQLHPAVVLLLRRAGRQDPGRTLPLDKKGYFAFTRHEPVGVVAAITPWNSPLMLASWKIAPALAAGCTVVIKPSEFTSASTLEFAELFEEAGFPPGVFNVVTGFGAEVGTPLVEHPLVRKISFTGSDATGRLINEKAARHFKHTAMELGGKSPNIVFDDADLEQAVFGAISGIFAATGQTCIAGSRLLVQDSIHDAFVEKLLAVARTARMGDPMDPGTQVGPVTTPPQYKKVLEYIDIARGEGATAVLGGAQGDAPECGKGWFVQPTIFTGVRNDMRIAQEEVFGPVLSVIRFKDEAEARAHRQRRALRPGRRRLDQRHRPRDPHVGEAAGRHGLGQHLSRGELHGAVRRLQGLGPRAARTASTRSASTCRPRACGSTAARSRAIRSSCAESSIPYTPTGTRDQAHGPGYRTPARLDRPQRDAWKTWPPRRRCSALTATLDRDDPPTGSGQAIPPCWHWLYFLPVHRQSEIGPDGHARRGGFLPPVPLPRRMWAGSRLEFLAPVQAGQALSRTSRIADVRMKEGRAGPLVFVNVRHEISAEGRLAITEEHDIVYREMPQPGEPVPAGVPAPGRRAVDPAHRARRRAAVPLFGTHLQRPPHPLRPPLRHRGRRLSRPDRSRPADCHAAARPVAPGASRRAGKDLLVPRAEAAVRRGAVRGVRPPAKTTRP